jgi:hypothetical protein
MPKEEIKEEEKIKRIKILNNSYEILNKYNNFNTINHRLLLKLLIEIINNKTDIEFNTYYYKCLSLFNFEYYHFKDHNLLHLYNTPDDLINDLSNIDNHKLTTIFHIQFKVFIENNNY